MRKLKRTTAVGFDVVFFDAVSIIEILTFFSRSRFPSLFSDHSLFTQTPQPSRQDRVQGECQMADEGEERGMTEPALSFVSRFFSSKPWPQPPPLSFHALSKPPPQKQIRDEFAAARDVFKNREEAAPAVARVLGDEAAAAAAAGRPPSSSSASRPAAAAAAAPAAAAASSKTTTGRIIDSVAKAKGGAAAAAAAAAGDRRPQQQQPASSLVAFAPPPPQHSSSAAAAPHPTPPSSSSSDSLARRMPAKWPRPRWHPHWRCYRVVAGHLGWVRSLAVDPVSNEWFASGSADRTIKIWVSPEKERKEKERKKEKKGASFFFLLPPSPREKAREKKTHLFFFLSTPFF